MGFVRVQKVTLLTCDPQRDAFSIDNVEKVQAFGHPPAAIVGASECLHAACVVFRAATVRERG